MDINAAIVDRRSVREFGAKAIDEKTIAALIDAAIHAPSARRPPVVKWIS